MYATTVMLILVPPRIFLSIIQVPACAPGTIGNPYESTYTSTNVLLSFLFLCRYTYYCVRHQSKSFPYMGIKTSTIFLSLPLVQLCRQVKSNASYAAKISQLPLFPTTVQYFGRSDGDGDEAKGAIKVRCEDE